MTATRRLAAILVADVVGYSRLMEADEAGTLAALKERRKSILEPVVKEHGGRVVKVMGDGVLIEFASAVKAVEAAIELQEMFAGANAITPGDRRILLRIGINLGDVVGEGGDIYGDGVNIASRLEAIAEPGGICISDKVHAEARGKLEATFDDRGETNFKNIAAPIRVYRVRPSSLLSPDGGAQRLAPKLPDKLSIAVLPFTNMSGEPEHEFLADGMTEDLITALSRIGELFVISRNSSFVYKGQARRLESVARELGVKYLLEGSIRAAGGKVRITAQLIDGQSGHHLWAERYDGNLDDVFGLQDEITRNIAVALHIKLAYGELARLWDGQTKDLRAWEKMVRARTLFLKFNPIDNSEARRTLEDALHIDPNYTGAMIQLGLTYWTDARFNIAADKEACLGLAEQQAAAALRIDPRMGSAHMLQGGVAFLRDRHDEAIRLCAKGVDLSPSDSWATAFLSLVHVYSGEARKALAEVRTAMRLSPFYPFWYDYVLALTCLWMGDLAGAQEAAERDAKQEDDPPTYANLALVYAFQGDEAAAARAIDDLRREHPAYSMKEVLLSERYKERDKLDRVVAILRKAGLPE